MTVGGPRSQNSIFFQIFSWPHPYFYDHINPINLSLKFPNQIFKLILTKNLSLLSLPFSSSHILSPQNSQNLHCNSTKSLNLYLTPTTKSKTTFKKASPLITLNTFLGSKSPKTNFKISQLFSTRAPKRSDKGKQTNSSRPKERGNTRASNPHNIVFGDDVQAKRYFILIGRKLTPTRYICEQALSTISLKFEIDSMFHSIGLLEFMQR